MAIPRNAATNGNFIKDPGEYRVKCTEAKTGMSKKGQPMLTVTFSTFDDKSIRAYFVKALPFHLKALSELKTACGLKASDSAENLVGRECGILVEMSEMGDKTFAQITGYGPAAEIGKEIPGAKPVQTTMVDDDVPF